MPMQGDVKRSLQGISSGTRVIFGVKNGHTRSSSPEKVQCSRLLRLHKKVRGRKEKLESSHVTKWLVSQCHYSAPSSTAAPTTV